MKGKVLALLVGLILGSTGAAVAATSVWREVGNTYVCRGLNDFAMCRSRGWKPGYEISIDKKSVEIFFGSHVVFACDHKWRPEGCDDFR